MWGFGGEYPVAGRIICAQGMCFAAKSTPARQVVTSTWRAQTQAGRSDHADDVFADRQDLAAFGNVFDQKFAHHLVAQSVAQPLDPGGAGGLFAIAAVLSGNHRLDLGA